jgi:parvulin-like peptidyl-prolyl isomerase
MKKLLLTILTCLAYLIGFSQTTASPLNDINTVKQAKKFIAKYPESSAQLITLSSDKDTTDITPPLYDKNSGDTFRLDAYDYKILDKTSYPEFRVSYIFLDGSQLNAKTIDRLRTEIVNKYKSGTPFSDLANAYTMDATPNGDVGWFKENVMAKEFELAVKEHKRNDLFTVDIPASKWYFVVLKTFDDRITKRLTVLKIKTGI